MQDIKGKCIVVRVDDFDVTGEGFVNQGDSNTKYPAVSAPCLPLPHPILLALHPGQHCRGVCGWNMWS